MVVVNQTSYITFHMYRTKIWSQKFMSPGIQWVHFSHRSCINWFFFQSFLPRVSLKLIHNDEFLKYMTTCRDDFIRCNGKYNLLLLNPKLVVMPSVTIVKNESVKVITCKYHNNGDPHFMIHPPRQPNHIIPSRYSDQMYHAVINNRTLMTSKAQQFSNT